LLQIIKATKAKGNYEKINQNIFKGYDCSTFGVRDFIDSRPHRMQQKGLN
jgi:hypothetical protein